MSRGPGKSARGPARCVRLAPCLSCVIWAYSCAYGTSVACLAVRVLSQSADGVYQVALATYVVFSPENQTTPAAIASAMAVLLLPYSLIGPFAGVLLDRWPRRQVFLYGNLLRAALAC